MSFTAGSFLKSFFPMNFWVSQLLGSFHDYIYSSCSLILYNLNLGLSFIPSLNFYTWVRQYWQLVQVIPRFPCEVFYLHNVVRISSNSCHNNFLLAKHDLNLISPKYPNEILKLSDYLLESLEARGLSHPPGASTGPRLICWH